MQKIFGSKPAQHHQSEDLCVVDEVVDLRVLVGLMGHAGTFLLPDDRRNALPAEERRKRAPSDPPGPRLHPEHLPNGATEQADDVAVRRGGDGRIASANIEIDRGAGPQ